jgi:DNA-binding MarR family transcriptional regulator
VIQATTRPRAASARRARDEAAVVEALYEIAVATRRLSRADRVDTGGVRLLWHLAEAGTCRLSDLAELAGLDLSTVSRHVRDLDEAGYLRRTPDPRDRRAVVLEISPDGAEVLADAQANRAAALTPVLATWSADDRADLTRLLTALACDLTAAGRAATDSPTTDEDPA